MFQLVVGEITNIDTVYVIVKLCMNSCHMHVSLEFFICRNNSCKESLRFSFSFGSFIFLGSVLGGIVVCPPSWFNLRSNYWRSPVILTLQDAGEQPRPQNVVLVGHWNPGRVSHPNVYMEMDLSVQGGLLPVITEVIVGYDPIYKAIHRGSNSIHK